MVIVALAVIDAAVAVIIAIASHGWQSQAMAGPLPSLFVVFHHDSGCGGWWGEGGARGGSWRPPLPPLTVDAVIVVVAVVIIAIVTFSEPPNSASLQTHPSRQTLPLMPRSSKCSFHPRFTLSGELRNSWYRYPPPTSTLAHPPLLSTPHPPLGPLGPKGPQVSQGVGGGSDRRGGWGRVGVGGWYTYHVFLSSPT